MNVPPIIGEAQAKQVEVEVLPPDRGGQERSATAGQEAPIHALSAVVLVAVDSLWALFDLAPPIWIVAIPLCFVAVFVPTYLIQRNLKRDEKGRAITFAALLATLAAIPTPITGTPVGIGLLAWTGIGRLLGRPK